MSIGKLGKYSFGVGDRFAQEAAAQLAAIQKAKARGVSITPVWNKSFREHSIAKSRPASTRIAADAAVKELHWTDGYFVDADHVNLDTVDEFIDCSDYFTIDVAEHIGKPARKDEVESFVLDNRHFIGSLKVHDLVPPFSISQDMLRHAAEKYLQAVREAGEIYRHIRNAKASSPFVVEISMDEASTAQTPIELFIVMAAMAAENIPIQAIALKFSGRFNKGIDYVGDPGTFKKEFEADLAVIHFSVHEFGLPEDLKISVHTGSDKFSIYPVIREAIEKYDAGIHVKTAGTTWLEELIGLAEVSESGLKMAKRIYSESLSRLDALVADYTAVIDIDPKALPPASVVSGWDGKRFAAALRHDPNCPEYNPHFRQLLHVGFKIAAEMGDAFIDAINENKGLISSNVTANIYTRHLCRLFDLI
jgi:hypothetical protein